MDRYWFLTWTTYGTWLPGDKRGFVGPVSDSSSGQVNHNIPGTPYDADFSALRNYAISQMKGEPIYLISEQAEVMFTQFQETTEYRQWQLCAVGIIRNHVHLVVGVSADPEPSAILGTFKSYASRVLNRRWTKPPNGTWWTESGSKRKLSDEQAVRAAIRYVEQQANPLIVWIAEEFHDGEHSKLPAG